MTSKDDLALLQSQMLKALLGARTPKAALRRLLANPGLKPFHSWLRTVDAASWEVAMEVVKRYARPASTRTRKDAAKPVG